MGVAGEARGRRSGGDENENRGKGDGNLLTRRGRRGSRARRDKNRETPLGRVAPRRSDGDGAGSRCREREHSRASRRRRDDARAWGFPTKSARRFCQGSRGAREGGGDATCERRTRNRDRVGRAVPIHPLAEVTRPPMGAPPVNGHRGPPNARTAAANVERWRFLWVPRNSGCTVANINIKIYDFRPLRGKHKPLEIGDFRAETSLGPTLRTWNGIRTIFGPVHIFRERGRRVPRIIHETSATSTHPSRKRRASGHPRFQPRTHFLIDQITHQKITRKWRWKDRSVGRSVGSFLEKSFSHASRPSRYWEDQTRVRREDRVALRRDPILLLQSLDELRPRGSRFTVVPYQSSSILFPGDGAW